MSTNPASTDSAGAGRPSRSPGIPGPPGQSSPPAPLIPPMPAMPPAPAVPAAPIITAADFFARLRDLLNLSAVAAAAFLALAFQWQYDDSLARRRWEAHTRDMIDLARSLVNDLGESRSALRDNEIAADPAHAARAADARRRFRADFARIRRLTSDNAAQQANLDAVSAGADALFDRLDSGDLAAIAVFESLRSSVGRVIDEEARLLRARSAASDQAADGVRLAGRLASVPAFALVVDALARLGYARYRRPAIGGGR